MPFNAVDFASYDGQQQFPFLTHPYLDWQTYQSCNPAELMNRICQGLHQQDVPGLVKRIEQAKSQLNNPKDLFGFFAELKVAELLARAGRRPEFVEVCGRKGGTPDLFCEGVHIEVTCPTKSFAALVRLEEELQKTCPRFRFERQLALPHQVDSLLKKHAEIRQAVQNFSQQEAVSTPHLLYGNPAEDTILGLVEVDSLPYVPLRPNAHGRLEEAATLLIEESLRGKYCSKGKLWKNGLSSRRPNILWLEMLYSEEVQLSGKLRVPTIEDGVDLVVVTACGLDELHSRQTLKKVFRGAATSATDSSERAAELVDALFA